MTYSNVRVSKDNRLGAEGDGKGIVYGGTAPSYLIALGSVWSGVAEAALDAAVEHATRFVHKDFGKRIADYQVIRAQLAEARILVESLKPWRRELAATLDHLEETGGNPATQIIPLTEFKVHASEAANRIAGIALDVTGGYGYSGTGPLQRIYRDARAGIAMGPSNNIAREWIGKAEVGLPLELWFEGGE